MLKTLQIDNLILIESSTVSFGPGFNVITGETGAGKSLFLSALKLLSGQKAPSSCIRKGADKARVEACFQVNFNEIPNLKEVFLNLELDLEDEIVIQREILSSGKSRARVNGTMINNKDLQQIGPILLQMHGQSEQILLRDTSKHGKLLDGLSDIEDELALYKKEWQSYRAIQKKILELEEQKNQSETQQDFFRFQFDELKKAELKEGEDDTLESELTSLESVGELNDLKNQSLGFLSESNDSILSQLQSFIKISENYSQQSHIKSALESATEAQSHVEDALHSIRSMDIPTDVSPYEIDKKNSRLATLQRLKRKYNTDLLGLIEFYSERESQLKNLDQFDTLLTDLQFDESQSLQKIWTIAEKLHSKRVDAARDLDTKVTHALGHLGMDSAEYKTQITLGSIYRPKTLNSRGADEIEFLVKTNAGGEFQSLKKGISGGELSRVMLALKSSLADQDKTPILLFDEVDSGISGEVGHSIGECMKQLGGFHQILCITHLHQVAVQAQHQLIVAKSQNTEGTLTQIENLTEETRIQEIARMLGGSQDPNWLEQAKRLLSSSTNDKAVFYN
tara:strand:+ start:770 stop:2470 length:1701 start_codon:yes stop_codon:yes gene_type:complete